MNCKSSHRQKMLNGGEGAREAENEIKRKKNCMTTPSRVSRAIKLFNVKLPLKTRIVFTLCYHSSREITFPRSLSFRVTSYRDSKSTSLITVEASITRNPIIVRSG